MRVGIIGHRSWIAESIRRHIFAQTHTTFDLSKDPQQDLSSYDVVFLIAGRSRPTSHQMDEEQVLVSNIMASNRHPEKLVYLSSLSVERRGEGDLEPYAAMKSTCEAAVISKDWGRVVRAPVIFGPRQSPFANMLLPAIARASWGLEPLTIKEPLRPFHLMHADDVAHAMWRSGLDATNYWIGERRILSLYSNVVTPLQVVDIVTPGLPIAVPQGWSAKWKAQEPAEQSHYRWHFDPKLLQEAVWSMVDEISNLLPKDETL